MGYTTYFDGQIEITPALSPEIVEYINKFSKTRRMKRDVDILKKLYKGDGGYFGEYGAEGEYFVGGEGLMGQTSDESILEYNDPPSTQPGLWCQWVITEDGKYIEWDGGEKFYESAEWMEYIIENFIGSEYSCNGEITAQGEDNDDHWRLVVNDNFVEVEESFFVSGKTITLGELIELFHDQGLIEYDSMGLAVEIVENEGFTLNSIVTNL